MTMRELVMQATTIKPLSTILSYSLAGLPETAQVGRWGEFCEGGCRDSDTQYGKLQVNKLWIDLIFIKKGSEVPNHVGQM